MSTTNRPVGPTEDIAVIGLSCRFPGGASDPSKFWDLLSEKRSAFSKVPAGRYNADAFYNNGSGKQGTLRSEGAHFIDQDPSTFDAPFFNITAQEAKAMDPAARMLLEVTYEGIENAGIPIESLAGSDTSCHVGCFTRDYHDMLMRDAESAPMYSVTGTGFSLLSNRVSWFYDFRGPSMTLDTACSSSLVALHLACRGLRAGDSKVAVVCGANLLLSPDLGFWLSNLQMASKDGLSRAFAEGVTGYGRGEGIASVILKPLSEALRDGDSVRSIIRGTGVNQDGHTAGITLPNGDAQADLIRSTYREAKLDFADTVYFEAHGTGTAAGDPLELAAVAQTISAGRQARDELYVGSVKTNIGHLEGAAGLAGVIKCILMLENEVILPNIHFEQPNKRIPFSKWRIQVPTEVIPWPKDRPFRASVNSFGYGGTNAHAILDSTKEYLNRAEKIGEHALYDGMLERTAPQSQRSRLFVLSAPDEGALGRMTARLGQHLSTSKLRSKAEERAYMDRLSYTLSDRRSRHGWKTFFTASSTSHLGDILLKTTPKKLRSPEISRLALCFTGQGAQWARMGQGLWVYPVFEASVSQADQYLKRNLGCSWSVLEELASDASTSRIQEAAISQPLCTVLQIALVELLCSWGISPTGVVGHSSGEIAAGYCYGALTREDCWSIAYWRGKICSELNTRRSDVKGSMMAAGLSQDQAATYIKSVRSGRITLACVNSPNSVTISGDESGIDELQKILSAESVFCRKLKVENAYHSHHMELAAEEYLQRIAHIKTQKPLLSTVKMVSSVSGQEIAHDQLGPDYWVKNFVSPVLFFQAMTCLLSDNSRRRRRKRAGEVAFDLLLEVGPHSTLRGPIRQILQHQQSSSVIYHSVLSRGENDVQSAISAAGELFLQGVPVDISAINLLRKRILTPLTDLPSYPWNHSLKYWAESRVSKNYQNRKYGRHDLLGAPVPDFSEQDPRWRNFIRVNEMPWVRDHAVHGSMLYPGSGFIAMVLEAARMMADPDKKIDKFELEEVRINNAIVIPDNQSGVETILQFRQQRRRPSNASTGRWEWTVSSSLDNGPLVENSTGLVSIYYNTNDDETWATNRGVASEAVKEKFLAARTECTRQILPKDFYEATLAAGFKYDSYFQGLQQIWTGKDLCCAVIDMPDTRSSMPNNVESPHLIHPSTLDVVFHSIFAAFGGDQGLNFENAAVPIAFDRLTFSADIPSGSGHQLMGFSSVTRSGPRDLIADIHMSDPEWEEPKIQILGMRCRELSSGNDDALDDMKAPLGTLEWKPDIRYLNSSSLQGYLDKKLLEHSDRSYDGVITNGHAAAKTLERSTCVMTDLATHENPDCSILQIGGNDSLTRSLLSTVGAGQGSSPARFSTYTIAHTDAEWISEAEKWLPEVKVGVTFKLFKTDAPNESFKNDTYDFVIAGDAAPGVGHKRSVHAMAHAALKGGGMALLGNSICGSDTLSRKTKSLDPLSLHIMAEVATNPMQDSTTLALMMKQTSEIKAFANRIYILESPKASKRAQEISQLLVSSLSQQEIEACILPWSTDVATLRGKTLISMVELESSIWTELEKEGFERLRTLTLQSSGLLWVSMGDHDPVMHATVGYLRVLQNENSNLNLRHLHLEQSSSSQKIADIVARVVAAPTSDREYTQMDGALCISRWVPRDDLKGLTANKNDSGGRELVKLGDIQKNLKMIQTSSGSSKTVYFDVDGGNKAVLGPSEAEIEVRAVAINGPVVDSMQDADVRFHEFSGVVTNIGRDCAKLKVGSRVCAFATGPYKSLYRVSESRCLLMPGTLTFEESTSWSLSLPTAYQAIHNMGPITSSKFVLIQAAASSVGQAAIQLTQRAGATVIAIVTTAEERSAIEALGVDTRHILRDGDPRLSNTISRLTQDKGLDIILNLSLVGDSLLPLWHSIASFGVLIDAVAGDDAAAEASFLDLGPFRRGASYSVLDMRSLIRDKPQLYTDILGGVSEMMSRQPFKPLSGLQIFSSTDAVEAFQQAHVQPSLASVVMTLSPDDQITVPVHVANPLVLDTDATYLLVGGLGGLGRSLARLFVSCGARNIALISRSGDASPNAKALEEELASANVTARIYACDVANAEDLKRTLVQCAAELPPIRGVVQAAAVLNDTLFENMSWDEWNGTIRPKVHGTKLLHDLLPSELQFFAMLSSISGVVGNRGQANYAAGNTYLDGFAAHRRRRGLPAISIDLGLMLEIGMAAERSLSPNLNQWAAVALNEHMFQSIMTAAMAGSLKGNPIPTQIISGLATAGIVHRKRLEKPLYFEDPRFALLKKLDLDGTETTNEATVSLSSQLEQCETLESACEFTTVALCQKIAFALQTPVESIDPGKPLHVYGVDSLMAVDIRTWALAEAKAEIALFEVLSGTGIATLARKIATVSKLVLQKVDSNV